MKLRLVLTGSGPRGNKAIHATREDARVMAGVGRNQKREEERRCRQIWRTGKEAGGVE